MEIQKLEPTSAAPTIAKPDVSLQRDILLEWLTSRVVLAIGSVLGLASLLLALRNAMRRSQDFQWSAMHLILHHRDPWAVYLSGDRMHQILLSQLPLYLHELYLVLLPFGFLSFAKAKLPWALCNVCFILVLGWCVASLCEIGGRKRWILFLLVLVSTPFRVTIENGQNDALCLMCLGLWAVVVMPWKRGMLLGVAYAKYSLPPVLVLFVLLRRRARLLLFSIIPPLVGFLCVGAWLHTRWEALAFDPFLVEMHQRGGFVPGVADLMSLTGAAMRHLPFLAGSSKFLPYLLAVAAACALAGYFFKNADRTDGRVLLACLLLASLVCFQHMIYDFLILIFSLGIALSSRPRPARSLALLLIAYFWYFERAFGIWRWESHLPMLAVNFCLLLLLLITINHLGKTTEWSSRWDF